MKWNLEVQIHQKPSFKKILHDDLLMSVGSCFSEHIGVKLEERAIRINNNPYGILYNPFSIQKALLRITEGRHYEETELMQHNKLWLSLDHHSSFSSPERSVALQKINASIDTANDYLRKASTIIVTFGTAYYYRWKADGRIAGNNHKIEASAFQREMAAIPEIVAAYSKLIGRIGDRNPGLQWIFTVSPVRHWKNGAADNNRSKSILVCAVRELTDRYDHVHYFPSYEIQMDELRDHRFYAEDLIHPNRQAIDHIWNKFSESCLDVSALGISREVMKYKDRLAHRLLFPESEESKRFTDETEMMKLKLMEKVPYLH